MEGQVERTWRQARTWDQLLGDICASNLVDDNQIVFDISYFEQEGDPTNRFCIGIPSGRYWMIIACYLRRTCMAKSRRDEFGTNILDDGLVARGFVQSEVDMCLYFHPQYKVNLLIYTDDGILTGDSDADIGGFLDNRLQLAVQLVR
jgi:hypothetical protein